MIENLDGRAEAGARDIIWGFVLCGLLSVKMLFSSLRVYLPKIVCPPFSCLCKTSSDFPIYWVRFDVAETESQSSLSWVNDNISRPDWALAVSAESEKSLLCYSGGQKPRVKLQPRDSIYSPRLQTGKLNENNIMMEPPPAPTSPPPGWPPPNLVKITTVWPGSILPTTFICQLWLDSRLQTVVMEHQELSQHLSQPDAGGLLRVESTTVWFLQLIKLHLH